MASCWAPLTLAVAMVAAPFTARPAAQPAAPATATDPALPTQDLGHPPPGSPEDQALWRSGHEVTLAVQIERARASRLQLVLLNLRYGERVQALAERDGAAGEEGAALKRRLGDAHARQFSVLAARWPVDTYRVCGYPAMEFGSMLAYGKADPGDLAKHRAMLVGCVEQAEASVKLLKEGNDGLEEAMRAADEAGRADAARSPGAPEKTAAAHAPRDEHPGRHDPHGGASHEGR